MEGSGISVTRTMEDDRTYNHDYDDHLARRGMEVDRDIVNSYYNEVRLECLEYF